MAVLLRTATTQGYLLICMGCADLTPLNHEPQVSFVGQALPLSCQLLYLALASQKFAMADQSSSANAAEAAERSKSEALAAAEKGSPIVTLLAKRIRAAKKRLGKIESMEKLRDTGKPMNADQVGCSSMCMARAELCMHSQRTSAPLGPGSSSCSSILAWPSHPPAAWPLHRCSEPH